MPASTPASQSESSQRRSRWWIDPAFERFATGKIRRALELVQKADQATTSKKKQRLLGNAAKRLGRIAKHRSGTTTAGCRESLSARVDGVLAAIDDLRRR
jgi:hypothetical protein